MIEWVKELPPHARVVGEKPRVTIRYLAFAQEIKGKPMTWARLPRKAGNVKSAQTTARNIRNGRLKAFSKGSYDVATDGAVIYVRYNGREPANQDNEQEQPNPIEIRRWGQEHGLVVGDRGRLPQELVDQYLHAHHRGPRTIHGTEAGLG